MPAAELRISTPPPIASDFLPRPLSLPSDPTDLLPASAASVLAALRDKREDLQSAILRLSDEISELRSQRQQAQNRIRLLTAGAQNGGYQLPSDDQRVVLEVDKEKSLSAKIDELT